MLVGARIIPFHRPPKKEWAEGMEKKKRLVINLDKEEDDDIEEENYNTSYTKPEEEDDSESDDDEIDLLQHLADLLPGDLVDGFKPTKEANRAHLDDLKPIPKKVDRLKWFKQGFGFVDRMRTKERERRKHYILVEWEERIKKYDEEQKQNVLDEMEKQRKELVLEQYRSEQRRIKNSVKKVERKQQIEQFTTDLNRRDENARRVEFYSKNLMQWAIEGYDRDDRDEAERQRRAEEKRQKDIAAAKKARKKELMQEDAAILAEDKRISKEIEMLMVRYGTVQYEPDDHKTQAAHLDDIFHKNRDMRTKQQKLDEERTARVTVGDDSLKMKLTLKEGLDLVVLKKRLKKNAHRRTRDPVPSPFKEDLSGTGQILTLKAEGIQEGGALSFANELTRGACPMLEVLNLSHCQVKSDGIGRIFQGIKSANLLSLRSLNLNGNLIRRRGIDYMMEICPSGVFMNLEVLNLDGNELGDDGVGSLISIILQGHFLNMKFISVQHNSITDIGFKKVVMVMKSLQETKCPKLERFRLENNLVSPAARRRNAPYPACLSF